MYRIYITISVIVLICGQALADSREVSALVEALRLAAPKNKDTSLYTDWKMRPKAIASWTKRCLGKQISPTELARQPNMARNTVACVMGPVFTEQLSLTQGDEELAVRKAAAWWMTGDTMQYQAKNIATYLGQVVRNYQKIRSDH